MKNYTLKNSMTVPAIIVGCMRLADKNCKEMNHFIHSALEQGAFFFDHADFYGAGRSEEIFGEAWSLDSSIKREDMIIQSKCGIVTGDKPYYDFSKEHILESVDGILKRLKMDYIDILLLHRPDALVDEYEVAEAFDKLKTSGKVRSFGVSNHKPLQIELLKRALPEEKLIINQLQFSIPVSNMVASGLEVNMETPGSIDRDGSILDYCRLNDITIQAWSPFQMPAWRGCFIGNDEYSKLNKVLNRLAEKYNSTPTAIATAWILRHPAKMQVVAGTSSEDRLKEIIGACEVELTRPEWYELYLAAGHILP